MPEGKKIVCVVGPTACGKTTLGVLLAQRFGGEVVSADSMQIYRGMTIGTAAPTEAEMGGVPHHMIAVADPRERWSAARYAETAIPIVDDILRRGKLPILVGGTGLWLEAVVRGRSFAAGQAGGAVRAELQRQLEAGGIAPLLEELRTVDPEAAERLHPADEKRILRALEVWRETGKTISEHNRETGRLPPRYDAVWIGLRFADREDMRSLIDRRVDAMAAAGLTEEVRALVDQGVPRDSTAMQAIGYKELLAVLDGQQSREEALETVKLRSRQYAKRQLTWLRRNPEIHWICWGEKQTAPEEQEKNPGAGKPLHEAEGPGAAQKQTAPEEQEKNPGAAQKQTAPEDRGKDSDAGKPLHEAEGPGAVQKRDFAWALQVSTEILSAAGVC
ncbi:tRNA (adenosine(37)-N6)-dimethylallyltransferase MiaA [uncultured Oscillibacter sp.]|uniref:tRNA (adenosine(37)-N6)-dimethylallyltransferase MiaA n=1 Tax=uncultured Oscillibacter sp. TaxID=876091 RepID=UPI0026117045|nr:tRNA (adenosine(37)-N6)-dimethylallyltransferase MiaA [uncultured Oscillibacter sp.]